MAGVQAAIEKTVMETAKVIESELDAEIERLDNMNCDELEKLRYLWPRWNVCSV